MLYIWYNSMINPQLLTAHHQHNLMQFQIAEKEL